MHLELGKEKLTVTYSFIFFSGKCGPDEYGFFVDIEAGEQLTEPQREAIEKLWNKCKGSMTLLNI